MESTPDALQRLFRKNQSDVHKDAWKRFRDLQKEEEKSDDEENFPLTESIGGGDNRRA